MRLVELYQRTVDIEDNCIRINFHFDCVCAGVRVASVRDGATARLTVQNETEKATHIRGPAWTPASSLQLLVNDVDSETAVSQGFLHVPGNSQGTDIMLRYALPETTTQEIWRDAPAKQESVTFRWRGDDIIDVEPGGCYMAPFAKPCASFGQ
jgi:hypothetical protein